MTSQQIRVGEIDTSEEELVVSSDRNSGESFSEEDLDFHEILARNQDRDIRLAGHQQVLLPSQNTVPSQNTELRLDTASSIPRSTGTIRGPLTNSGGAPTVVVEGAQPQTHWTTFSASRIHNTTPEGTSSSSISFTDSDLPKSQLQSNSSLVQPLANMSIVADSSIVIPMFSGDDSLDIRLFIDIVEQAYEGLAKLTSEQLDANRQRNFCLMTHTTGEAARWVNGMSSETRKSWRLITESLIERFQSKSEELTQLNIWSLLINLKQGKKTIHEYVAEARRLRKMLPKENDSDVRQAFIKGLEDISIRHIVGGIARGSNQTFEQAVLTSLGATEEEAAKDRIENTSRTTASTMNERDVEFIRAMQAMQETAVKSSSSVATTMRDLTSMLSGLSLRTQGGGRSGMGQSQAGQPTTAGYPPQNNTGPPAPRTSRGFNPQCFSCGGWGHLSSECDRPPLAVHEQARLREEFRRAQEDRRMTGNRIQGTAVAATAQSQYRYPQGQDSHEDPVSGTVRYQPSTFNSNFLDSREANAVEVYHRDGRRVVSTNASTGEKRKAPARHTEDLEPEMQNNVPMLRKKTKSKTGATRLSDSTMKKQTVTRNIRAMVNEPAYDIWADLKNGAPVPTLSYAQLMNVAPKCRARVAWGLTLEAKPESEAVTVPRAHSSSSRYQATVDDDVDEIVRPIAKARNRSVHFDAVADSENNVTMSGAVEVNALSAEVRQKPATNFYTTCSVASAQEKGSIYEFDKVLVDGGSTICMINGQHARGLDYVFNHDPDLYMKNADGSEKAVPHYVVLPIKVAGVVRTMEVYVIDGPTAYSLLLGRNWMEKANVIGDYGKRAYYICGDGKRCRKLKQWKAASSLRVPAIFRKDRVTGAETQLSGGERDYDEGDDVDRECEEIAERMASAIVNEYRDDESSGDESSNESSEEEVKDHHAEY